jgi:GlpG protein
MRKIGSVTDQKQARTFCDFLYAKGIENECEPNSSGTFDVWVHRDEQLDEAEEYLQRFESDPANPEFKSAARAGEQLFKQQQRAERQQRSQAIDVRTKWGRGVVVRMGGATAALMAISIGTYLMTEFGSEAAGLPSLRQLFSISRLPSGGGLITDGETIHSTFLYEVRRGQIWRLFTPMFLHFGILHILFNMMWLKTLGSSIERADGTLRLVLQVLVIAAISNVAQYAVAGPYFGGMSGVVYGLFGYAWIVGKHAPETGMGIDQNNVIIMLVWAGLCLTGLVGPVANTAHFSGLACGLVWAAIRLRRIPFA